MMQYYDPNIVTDLDTPFTIDPITREIKNKKLEKKVLMQHDHNSERFRFEIPRYMEGRDVGLCNVVEIYYINVDAATREQKTGIYTVDDMEVYPFYNDILTCSWLISSNVTTFAGPLSFMIRFAQMEGDKVKYAWHTKPFEFITVAETIESATVFEHEYVDIIQQWKDRVMSEMYNYVELSVKNNVNVAQIDVNKNNIAGLTNDAAVLKSRMDEFSKLPEGSTSGDAELADIRVDSHGNSFKNAGDAVRAMSLSQEIATDESLEVVYLEIPYEKMAGMGIATNKNKQAIIMANSGTNLYYGVIDKTGVYNLTMKTLLTTTELNTSSYVDYIYYDETASTDVFIEAGTYFYVLGALPAPSLKVTYLPERIIVGSHINSEEYSIVEGGDISYSNFEALLEAKQLRGNTGRYIVNAYPVIRGNLYRLRSDAFDYPSDTYQLFGFIKCVSTNTLQPYIKGGISTNPGVVDLIVRAPIDGYMLVTNDSNYPVDFKLTKITSLTKRNKEKFDSRQYNKLLTIGDSLSGNSNLWQPTAIELLDIPAYGILGGAGLTVADQGASVNTIYNRVMGMELDEDVDLITFWGGYNDFNTAIPISTLSEQLKAETRNPKTFYGGVLNCVEKILSTYPLKQIVMIGTTPFNVNGSWHIKKNSLGFTITDYVNAFREVAEYYSIPFLDLLHTSGFNDYNYSTYYMDQSYWLHPNAVGHAVVGRKIAGFIKSIDGKY